MKRRIFTISLYLAVIILSAQSQDRPDALASYNIGNYAGAVEICLAEIQAAPESRDSYAVLCWSFISLKQYEEAFEYAAKAYAFAPNDPRIIEVLGEANYFLGRNLEALGLFEKYAVIADTGGRIDRVYYLMGEVFIRLGEYNHADIAFSTALYHSPNISAWWGRLGYAREMASDFANSLEAYNKALALNPNLLDADRGRTRVQSALN
jgi:tetratricopeptide (TPR) repeat protein